MGKSLGIIFFLLCLPVIFLGQTYNYVQYTTRDGLAGNMVYDMCQSRDGFLWFGTDNGLSRFDGKQFKNFTVKDGLPDNEILMFFEDSKGRLWFSTFSNELCYYWNGNFYSAKNDSNLINYKSLTRPTSFWEAPDGTIWVMGKTNVYSWPDGGRLTEYQLNPSLAERIKTQAATLGPGWFGENPGFSFNDSIFYLRNGKLNFYKKTVSKSGIRVLANKRDRGDTGSVALETDIIHQFWQSDFPRLVGSINGAFEIDSVDWRIKERFLPGKGVTRAWVDFEGIYWFATQGDGIYKLTSKSALTYKLGKDIEAVNEIFSIGKRNDSVFTGHGGSRLVIWNKNRAYPFYFGEYLPIVENSIASNRLKAILPLPGGYLVLGFDGFLIKWKNKVKEFLPLSAIKTVELINENELLVASGVNVLRVSLNNFEIIDTIWGSRATSATVFNGKYYLGTLSGLAIKNMAGIREDLVEFHPSLKRRVVSLVKSENSLWVATSDSGLVEIKPDGKIGRTFWEKDGLSSNICRSLVIDEDEMWVGTNKGICKINLTKPSAQIIKYNSFNLLPNDAISVLLKGGDEILVGSPSGLTIFEEAFINSPSLCRVFIDKIEGSGKVWKAGEKIGLPFRNNGIDIDFSGISMKSAGEMFFHYRIEGLEKTWSTTSSNRISIAGLPPGHYNFRIYAVNKFGVKSKVVGFAILVDTPFWRTLWFIGFLVIIGIGLVYYLLKIRNNRIHFNIEEKNRIEKQLASLEQKALQAQMNPHFIFNSLNSIQQYILTNNVADANKYLSIFAALIRETLENSSSGKIPLKREIGYITKYLELERMRFGNTFNFQINTSGLDPEAKIEIPVMLLQPYVENAVRHGIRYRTADGGLIEIDFRCENDTITCIIRDNGPGRAAREQIKSKQHIEYQSQGMALTQRRVDILNLIFEEQVLIEVKDVINEAGEVTGTEVHIYLTQLNNETSD